MKSLTTKEVARVCSVSDATVKRWAEAGVLQSERTNGGHRRFRAEEVARFQREIGFGQNFEGLPVKKTSVRTAKKSQSGSPLFQALIAAREDEAAEILINAFLQGEPLAGIFDREICPALGRVGELWFEGKISIAEEHLATRTIINAVQKLRNVVPVADSNGKLALCCTIEGDYHELPSHLVQILFESEGWEVLNFGANLPLYTLAQEALEHNPDLICISATIIPDADRAARDFSDFRREIAKTNCAILLGGRAFTEERTRSRFGSARIVETFPHLMERVTNLN